MQLTRTQQPERQQAPNLQKGLAILEHLASHSSDATITELSEVLKFPTASVYRITTALMELGYLSRDPKTKRFSLTNKFLLLGKPSNRDRSLSECSIEPMRRLRRSVGETTQLCCLVGTELVIVDQLLSVHPFKYSADLGARCPCYSCAPGKAILAHWPRSEQEPVLSEIRFKPYTETTITSRSAFEAELRLVRQNGYAVDRGEGLVGIHCVAAPVLDQHGDAVAAITVAGPANRLPPDDFEAIGLDVISACQEASKAFNS